MKNRFINNMNNKNDEFPAYLYLRKDFIIKEFFKEVESNVKSSYDKKGVILDATLNVSKIDLRENYCKIIY
jgi:hypothetical protein